ncbi:MAG: gamma-glutamyltransferase [Planctomycetes bacterium]|nr:gamma-glutamyltransferase [Planctomycetota bacterium]MBL7044400.1 gamma-glutamyltransferase [Pirellulaceae bacterium]
MRNRSERTATRSRYCSLVILTCFAILPSSLRGRDPVPVEQNDTAARVAKPAVQEARGDLGMVVSETETGSCVGRDVLAKGGNAVDAAVAVAFAMAVTWPEAGNIGGGGFMLVYPGSGREPVCIDYREMAPAAATKTMFSLDENRFTHKMVGVPGTVRGLALAHERYGSLKWNELVEPAVRLAEDGFTVDRHLAGSLNGVLKRKNVRTEARYAELRRVYGHPDDRPWKAGDRMRLPDLAHTLALIADSGPDAFYNGPIADQLVAEMRRGGGLIAKCDLEGYKAKVREPIHGTFRGYDIFGPPPPSSGGIAVVEALNILENLDLCSHDRYSARNLHLIGETMRRVFCDRAKHLGDSDFVEIPRHLTEKAYARRLADKISPSESTSSESLAPEIQLADESSNTTHFSVIDSTGMAVANTYTLEASWGACVVVSGAGFVLNNEMGDFNWLPGHTDRKGRIGTPPNLIEPSKRMLSSQSPTIVARDGRAVLITGSPGGRTIINTVIGIVLNVLEFGMSLPEAVDSPRMHHQWFPDRLDLEGTDDARYGDAVKQLRKMGHVVRSKSSQGSAHSILVDPESGVYIGVADRRRGGRAEGLSRASRDERKD